MFPWGQFFAYIFVAAYTPGPNNIISLTNGSRLGWRRGIHYNFGQFFGLFIQMNLCVFGSLLLNELLPRLSPYMQLIGAVYILYLAWKTLKSDTELEELEGHSGFWYGFGMQFLNVKSYLSIFATAQAYLLPFYNKRPGILLLFCLGMTVNAIMASLCWLFGGSLFRRFLSSHGKAINVVMALLLAYCAISLFH